MSEWNQLYLFGIGDTLQEYRDRISTYFVKQENNHTVKKSAKSIK